MGVGGGGGEKDPEEDGELAALRARARERALERARQEEEAAPTPGRPQGPGGAGEGGRDSFSESDSERDLARRRALARARLAEGDGGAAAEEEGASEEDEYSSEYETDTSDDGVDPGAPLMKPVFLSRAHRAGGGGARAVEVSTKRSEEEKSAKQAETKAQLRQLFVAEVEEKAQLKGAGFAEVVTDDEGADEEGEFDLWREREFARIREARVAAGEEEASEEEAGPEAGAKTEAGEEDQRRFRQKYWHKGAFFQEVTDGVAGRGEVVDAIYKRDFSAPTGEDKEFSKESMPAVMQVAAGMWGKRGQTKYTHLKDQDTSRRDDPWNKAQRPRGNHSKSAVQGGLGSKRGGNE